MKHLAAVGLFVLLVPTVHAGASLKQARQLWLRGNYAEAQEMYAELVKAGKDRPAAAVGVSRALESQGDYEGAMGAIDAAIKAVPQHDGLFARRAELLYQTGRRAEAEKAARQALEEDDKNVLAHWIIAQLLRDRGETGKADDEYRWFIRFYNDSEVTDLDDLMRIGLAALERARLHHLHDQVQFVIDEIFNEAIKNDKDYWPAYYEKGRLFLEKHDKAHAHPALEKALTINPQAAEVLVVKGEVAAQGFEMRDAEDFADEALKINPRLPSALRLRADVYAFSGENDKAMKDLETARAVNPRSEETLARIASILLARKKGPAFEAIVKEVEANSKKPYTFYTELAGQLDGRKAYPEAEKYFKLAADLEPELPDAQTGLGLLYMRLGKENEAAKVLEAAHDADKFNVRVRNTLVVLDHLKKYATLRTDHYLIRYDAGNDEVLAKYMARYLEGLYREYTKLFDYRPEEPILIEVFSKHELFSGRVVALPDLHTIGACTGRMFAMVSIHDKQKVIPKPFNWERVVRHELVHVFNLEQTHFRVPHWFTEGLAVTHEGSVPPPNWTQMLADKLAADDLLNLDNVLLGFIRPRSPQQWHQAYAQSQLYVEYLAKTHGDAAVGKMLDAFGAGLDTAQALQKAVGVSKADFEKGYRAFLAEKVKGVPVRAAARPMTLKALKTAHEKDPKDVGAAARLAERYQQLGRLKEAEALADDVLRVQRGHPLALYVKALTLIAKRDDDLAYTLLEKNTGDDTADARPLKLLGKLQYETKKYSAAAKTFERCRKLEPYDTTWLGLLAKAYLKTDDQDKLLEIFKEVAKVDPDDLLPRKRLAKHYSEAKDHAEAERYARMGLAIDVLDHDCQTYLLVALDAQGKDEEARALRAIFGR